MKQNKIYRANLIDLIGHTLVLNKTTLLEGILRKSLDSLISKNPSSIYIEMLSEKLPKWVYRDYAEKIFSYSSLCGCISEAQDYISSYKNVRSYLEQDTAKKHLTEIIKVTLYMDPHKRSNSKWAFDELRRLNGKFSSSKFHKIADRIGKNYEELDDRNGHYLEENHSDTIFEYLEFGPDYTPTESQISKIKSKRCRFLTRQRRKLIARAKEMVGQEVSITEK
ncbi:hypothetical protein HYT26_04295 [Candidatus Pacearchaeota archaeon]|nr:hypothetical protein [Candidatus Pacearchaeota archaeon]